MLHTFIIKCILCTMLLPARISQYPLLEQKGELDKHVVLKCSRMHFSCCTPYQPNNIHVGQIVLYPKYFDFVLFELNNVKNAWLKWFEEYFEQPDTAGTKLHFLKWIIKITSMIVKSCFTIQLQFNPYINALYLVFWKIIVILLYTLKLWTIINAWSCNLYYKRIYEVKRQMTNICKLFMLSEYL